MIKITQIKCQPDDDETVIKNKTARLLGIKASEITDFFIMRQSIDARKKPEIIFVYEIYVSVSGVNGKAAEEKFILKHHLKNAQYAVLEHYTFPYRASGECLKRPLIVGMGPAGLFAGLMLARAGYKPIIIERGKCVEDRTRDVERFWEKGELDEESNVSFGEGGAGTFSDGKLNTLVKGSKDIHRYVLETFVQFGAQKDILYSFKPHIGTDVLRNVVKNIREEIIKYGGSVLFSTKLTELVVNDNRVTKAIVMHDGGESIIDTDQICLATGHSARDVFYMLNGINVNMEQKPFAVGVRMAHPQKMINISQYGVDDKNLPAASYKLTAQSGDRGVYSFCMCPGGYVVNASSLNNRLAVNGMSYSDRASACANSAIIVSVDSRDFGSEDVFAGINFQEKLERAAYSCGQGKIPLQCFGDFVDNKTTTKLGEVEPVVKGDYCFANLRSIFTEEINNALIDGVNQFGKKIKGFDRPDALMMGVESRTSSPVRIKRDEGFESNIKGLYPCGEGAGYAGGITSAAMDGIKVSQMIAKNIEEQS